MSGGQDFKLVDNKGEDVTVGERGLLLYNEGTVCGDDEFNANAANTICRKMGHSVAKNWGFGNKSEFQSNLTINLAGVNCIVNGSWSSCDYKSDNITSCEHIQDVFLTCCGGTFFEKFKKIDNKIYHRDSAFS